MALVNQHIIQKQVLEVEMENPPDAFQFRNRLGEVFNEKILPALNTLFDELGSSGKLIRIESLKVDTGIITSKNWEQELTDRIIFEIRQLLLLQNPVWTKSEVDSIKEKEKNDFLQAENRKDAEALPVQDFLDVFIFFLSNGRLPWFVSCSIRLEDELKRYLFTESIVPLKNLLHNADNTKITRLIYQIEEQSLVHLIQHLLNDEDSGFYEAFLSAKPFLKRVLGSVGISESGIKRLLFLPLFSSFAAHRQSPISAAYVDAFIKILLNEYPVICNDKHFFAFFSKELKVVSSGGKAGKHNVIVLAIYDGFLSVIPVAVAEHYKQTIEETNIGSAKNEPFKKPPINDESDKVVLTETDRAVDSSSDIITVDKGVFLSEIAVGDAEHQKEMIKKSGIDHSGIPPGNGKGDQDDLTEAYRSGRSSADIQKVDEGIPERVGENQVSVESDANIKIQPDLLAGVKYSLNNKHDSLTGEVYIENAGLILLHPFLEPFFKQLEYTNKDGFVNESVHMRAVLLTQFLVSQTPTFDEHQLVLNKILCGFPIDAPIMKQIEFTSEEKAEAADLLQQVIKLWKTGNVQVNGSVAGLQQNFLQRQGKVVQVDRDWRLQVEQKAYDMVLSSLPWGTGIIKNPWMKGILWVEWA